MAQAWSTAFFLLFLAAAAISAVLQHRFFVSLRSRHPTLWDDLRPFESWPSEHTEYAGAQIYLIAGRYRKLGDESLVRQGQRAQVAFFFCAAALVAWLISIDGGRALPSLSCLAGR